MKHKTSLTAALIALGIVSMASAAPIEIHVTGSTAFRGNFFTACNQASGGVFDSQPTILPAGANSGSSVITYVGNIGGVSYALECSWTGSEAGIANVDGVASLSNPGLPNGAHPTSGNLPGATTTFPQTDGTVGAGSFTGQGDLTLADTSQAVSLTRPPAHNALHDFGAIGIVTFTWCKGKNSTPTSGAAGDTAWKNLVNVTQPEMIYALGGPVPANFLTGVAGDNTTTIYMIGRNAGSGTRVNTMLDTFYGVGNSVSQFALNSTYAGASGDVLTYHTITTGADQTANQALTYPAVSASLGNTTDATTTPNALGIGNDGYESGGGLSQCLSCDESGSGVVFIGYLGLSDAKACRDGKANTAPTPNQPGGAVFLTLNGMQYDDSLVVNGTYSFWGHEHLYGQPSPSANANTVAAAIKAGIAAKGGLGNGTAGTQSSGIFLANMLADKPAGGDTGYPAPL